MNSRLRIPKILFDAMIAQAKAESPRECCGLLAGSIVVNVAQVAARFPLVNSAATPWNRFESSPESMFAAMKHHRALEIEVLAVYHSHPIGGNSPSVMDREMNYAPEVANIIIDLSQDPPMVKAWRIDGETVSEWEFDVCVEIGER